MKTKQKEPGKISIWSRIKKGFSSLVAEEEPEEKLEELTTPEELSVLKKAQDDADKTMNSSEFMKSLRNTVKQSGDSRPAQAKPKTKEKREKEEEEPQQEL